MKARTTRRSVIGMCGLLGWALLCPALGASTLQAAAFGLTGDGATDDGPALARAMAALRAAEKPAALVFETGRTYRIRSAPTDWAIDLEGARDCTVDGAGSTVLLDPSHRFVRVAGSTNILVRGFSLDYDPLPFAEGVAAGVDAKGAWLDVKVLDGFALPPTGGPTGEREQAYFGMIWHDRPERLSTEHLFITDLSAAPGGGLSNRVFRVTPKRPVNAGRIAIGRTSVTLPMRGIAHKVVGYGASPTVLVEENMNARFEDLTLWSAPLFCVNIARNRGACEFRRFNICARPGTARRTSGWRDGFHVKANRARLLFEDCRLEGMHDDSFNVATHSFRVTAIPASNQVRVAQSFPIVFAPFEAGDRLGGLRLASGRRFGSVRVLAAECERAPDRASPNRPAVPMLLTLAEPVEGLAAGDVVWDETAANPDTTIRRCTIANSCRFQSPVTLEACECRAFCWFYGDNLEGPLPQDAVIRACRFTPGRGNATLSMAFEPLITGPRGARVPYGRDALRRVRIEDCDLGGGARFAHVQSLVLHGNRFAAGAAKPQFRQCEGVRLEGNRVDGHPLSAAQIDADADTAHLVIAP